MKLKLLQPRPNQWLWNACLLAVLVVAGCIAYGHEPGEDLASSYVGCRLLVLGQPGHLYSYDPVDFDEIGNDDTWQDVADAGGYTGALHPYVQTPLWAYLLKPVCGHLKWTGFFRVFTVLSMFSLAGCLWLVTRHWAPSFFNPLALLAIVTLWVLSQPFQYAVFLMQTHVLLIFLTIAGLILAEREQWFWAGALIACAAAVKITPGLLVLYWLLTRRWKAAAWAMIWSLALWLTTVSLLGRGLTQTYLADLHRISRLLIVPMNNQSFAAWLMAPHLPPDEVFDVHEFPLPTAVRLASSALMIAFTIAGGVIDRLRNERQLKYPPIGAMMALVAATVFAPIAWTHYSVIIVIPVLVLLEDNFKMRSKWIWALLFSALVLNYRPISTDINHFLYGPAAIVRAQFYAWMLTLAALSVAAYLTLRRTSGLSSATS